jgi:hypothetical protein
MAIQIRVMNASVGIPNTDYGSRSYQRAFEPTRHSSQPRARTGTLMREGPVATVARKLNLPTQQEKSKQDHTRNDTGSAASLVL